MSVILLAILVWRWVSSASGARIEGDAEFNLTMAHSFATVSVLAAAEDGSDGELTATAYREPLPPLVLGVYLKAVQQFVGPLSIEHLKEGRGARLAKISNVFWGLILVLCVAAAIRAFTGSNALALAGAFAVGWTIDVDSLYTDLPAAAVLSLFSFLALKAIRTRRASYFLLAGASLGALCLTKGAFLYVGLAIVACLTCLSFYDGRYAARPAATRLAIFVLGSAIVVSPWVARNYRIFGSLTVTERGGIVLTYRAIKNQMNRTEYVGAFYVWAPHSIRGFVGKVLGFGPEDLKRGGRLQRLNRDDGTDFAGDDHAAQDAGKPEAAISYYRKARAERVKLRREMEEQGHPHPGSAADVELQRRAMKMILDHPLKHIATTLPFLWRGAPFVGPMLAIFAVLAWRRRQLDDMAYLLPSLVMVAFYAVASHNIPRYCSPAVPVVTVLCFSELARLRRNGRFPAAASTTPSKGTLAEVRI